MLRSGRMFIFAAYVVSTAVIMYHIWRAGRGKQIPELRRIAALDAIEEVVGRATEMGRPVLMSPGRAPLSGEAMGETVAGLAILTHVAGLTARNDVRFISPMSVPEVLPVAQDLTRQAYMQAGKIDAYSDDMVQFISEDRWGFTAGVVGLIRREKPAGAFLTGNFAGESLVIAETAVSEGAILISGTTNMLQIPFFVAASDYSLIGEELIAVGAYLSREPKQLASLVGEDWIKIAVVALLLTGSFMVTAGNSSLVKLMQK
jgi:hypothetical protein